MESAIPPDSDALQWLPKSDTKGEGVHDWTPVHVGARTSGESIGRIAALLARAFANDPEMLAALPDPAQRARVLPRLIGLNVRYGCLYGEVYTTPQLDGAAIWLPPGATTFTFGRIARSG